MSCFLIVFIKDAQIYLTLRIFFACCINNKAPDFSEAFSLSSGKHSNI